MTNKIEQEKTNLIKLTEILTSSLATRLNQESSAILVKFGFLEEETSSRLFKEKGINFKLLKKHKVINQSPYLTDKSLNLPLSQGLSRYFPVNVRCATYRIEQDNTVGYISYSTNRHCANILVNKDSGNIEYIKTERIKNSCILKDVSNKIEANERKDICESILNKDKKEFDEVFLMRTGYKSLKEFIEVKMPDLVSQLTDKNNILENIHNEGLNSIAKFNTGSISEENLLNASIVSQIYKNLIEGEGYTEQERIAYLDQMSYMDKYDDLITINNLNTINTELLCKLSAYGVDRFKTDNGSLAVFKLEDGTAIVSMDGSLSKYKPDELIEEFDGIYNTEELFEVLDMVYLGECSIEIDEYNGPAVKRKNKIKP